MERPRSLHEPVSFKEMGEAPLGRFVFEIAFATVALLAPKGSHAERAAVLTSLFDVAGGASRQSILGLTLAGTVGSFDFSGRGSTAASSKK